MQRELPLVMEQARVFISLGDDREEARLRRSLEEQTRHWAEKAGDPDREALLEGIAVTRQQAEKIGQTNRERERLIGGLEEVSATLREMEAEFAGLQAARAQTLPELREQLEALARHWSYLRAAHRELETRRGPAR